VYTVMHCHYEIQQSVVDNSCSKKGVEFCQFWSNNADTAHIHRRAKRTAKRVSQVFLPFDRGLSNIVVNRDSTGTEIVDRGPMLAQSSNPTS